MSGDWQAAEHNVLQCWYENSHSAEWNENKRKSFFLFLWLTFVLCGWWFYMVIWMPGKQLPMSRTLISVSNYIPQHLSHSIAFNNSDLWKRKVSLDISHHVPLFLHQQGVDNLKGTLIRTELQRVPNYFHDRDVRWLNSSIFPCCKQIEHKKTTINIPYRATPLSDAVCPLIDSEEEKNCWCI